MKTAGKLLLNSIIVLLAAYIVLMQVCPQQIKDAAGYQLYVIRTDSMEPVIPTGSVVLVKNLKEGREPELNTIVTFRADRLGEQAVFTHYLRAKEKGKNGETRYRTQGASAERYDDYETYRSDLVGTYVQHIPYIGRYILFLHSPFAIMELQMILIIAIINKLLRDKWDREERMEKKKQAKAARLSKPACV
ncbi:S26 family signal peptidase [Anaerovorax odorimutans]|uniref:S26 family signal peptidase n=1 Tax=Anaerovorax odorimutans TaxID=109327 RepID=A0ABT1RLJ3_9FIRM|nr:S26 family signal peptidase [Anaerovorax odorimutans]MCQ4636052.1 S26 family signal peptidase [Anaerovorax odorimutans]